MELLENYKNQLKGLNYSDNTINTYSYAFSEFLNYFSNKNISELSHDEVLSFLTKRSNEDGISSSYQNQLINSIKFYYEVILNQDKKTYYFKRPSKEEKLPEILSVEEVKELFSVIKNIKHKSIIYLLYSCGLRVSEAINLKFSDIDRKKMVLNIKQGNGKKDRVINLEPEVLNVIDNYYNDLKEKPTTYFFKGQDKEKYSSRSIQSFLKKYCEAAKIKIVSPHKLRHSYATHLRDLGIDLSIIQELLGHKSQKSALIYAKLSNKRINQLPQLIKNITN